VWAEIVDNVDESTILPVITQKVELGSTVWSDTWKAYIGVAGRGYLHCLVNHGEGNSSDGKGNHINGLEGFWGYLKRKLASKGGIKRARLPLYIAEYVWRYNHLADPERVKIQRILKLLEKS
jgi:transposase-like protein